MIDDKTILLCILLFTAATLYYVTKKQTPLFVVGQCAKCRKADNPVETV